MRRGWFCQAHESVGYRSLLMTTPHLPKIIPQCDHNVRTCDCSCAACSPGTDCPPTCEPGSSTTPTTHTCADGVEVTCYGPCSPDPVRATDCGHCGFLNYSDGKYYYTKTITVTLSGYSYGWIYVPFGPNVMCSATGSWSQVISYNPSGCILSVGAVTGSGGTDCGMTLDTAYWPAIHLEGTGMYNSDYTGPSRTLTPVSDVAPVLTYSDLAPSCLCTSGYHVDGPDNAQVCCPNEYTYSSDLGECVWTG